MFIRLIAVAMAACLLAVAAPASAQDAPEPSARQLELAGRYLELTIHVDSEHARQLLEAEMARDSQGEAAQTPTADQVALIEGIAGIMVQALVPLYARTYTEQELDEMISFYESSTGQALLRKERQIAGERFRIGTSVLLGVFSGAFSRCEGPDCDLGEDEP